MMQFKIYKSGQGYFTRLYTAIGLFVIVAVGCWVLYNRLVGTSIWVQTLVPSGLAAATGLFVFWLVNTPKVADFIIASEGEIKKVSWSKRSEVIVSTFIVIIVVALMSTLMFLADMLFLNLFMHVFNIY